MDKLEMIKSYCMEQIRNRIDGSVNDDVVQGQKDGFELVLEEIEHIKENY